jgi:predicted transcriptional regulator
MKVVAGENGLGREVGGGYVGDLLSCVMAKAGSGDIWVTVQGHPNIVAVATLVGASAIVVVEDAKIDQGTVEKAEQENVPLLTTRRSAFSVVSELAAMGIKDS